MPLSWRQMVMDSGSSCQVPRDQRLMGRLVGGLSHLSDPVWGEVSADGGGTAVQANCHTAIKQAQGGKTGARDCQRLLHCSKLARPPAHRYPVVPIQNGLSVCAC